MEAHFLNKGGSEPSLIPRGVLLFLGEKFFLSLSMTHVCRINDSGIDLGSQWILVITQSSQTAALIGAVLEVQKYSTSPNGFAFPFLCLFFVLLLL